MLHLFGFGGNSRKPRQPRPGQQQRLRTRVSDCQNSAEDSTQDNLCFACFMLARAPPPTCMLSVFAPSELKNDLVYTLPHTPILAATLLNVDVLLEHLVRCLPLHPPILAPRCFPARPKRLYQPSAPPLVPRL
jgi:hypothetical protein